MRARLVWMVLLVVIVALVGLYAAGFLGGDRQTGEQPSPHALDQSQ